MQISRTGRVSAGYQSFRNGRMARLVGGGLASALCLTPMSAYCWGFQGHELVARLASELSEEGNLFWTANADAVATFANTPDKDWKNGNIAQSEKPTHWFHYDFYAEGGAALPSFFRVYEEVVKRYKEETVVENGSATWRVEQFYLEALKSLRRSDYKSALQLAGAMSHYIGDLAQPLHVTVNYNGQLTNQDGIHKFFETTNLKRQPSGELERDVEDRARVLMNDPDFRKSFDEDLMHALMIATSRSVKAVPRVLSTDRQMGREDEGADELLDQAKDRLADGVATYALVLSRLWVDGGQEDHSREYSPRAPEWIAPDYSRSASDEEAGRGWRHGFTEADLSASLTNQGQQATNFVDCE